MVVGEATAGRIKVTGRMVVVGGGTLILLILEGSDQAQDKGAKTRGLGHPSVTGERGRLVKIGLPVAEGGKEEKIKRGGKTEILIGTMVETREGTNTRMQTTETTRQGDTETVTKRMTLHRQQVPRM